MTSAKARTALDRARKRSSNVSSTPTTLAARAIIAYRLLIKDSLEEKIRAFQAAKAALAHGVLGEEAFTRTLNLTELRSLLREG